MPSGGTQAAPRPALAPDIAQLYPLKHSGKKVLLVHSRERVMNKYHQDLHNLVLSRFDAAGIQTILSSRVRLPVPLATFERGSTHTLPLSSGSSVLGDLILLCTGQTPQSSLVARLSPSSLTSSGFIKVKSTLQLESDELAEKQSERIFALGDVAETGAWKTVRAAMGQVEAVSNNIIQLVTGQEWDSKTFQPGPAGIHLTLGLTESVKFGNPANPDEASRCLVEADGCRDIKASRVWTNFNVPKGTGWHL